jgi:hypothetical protein
MHSFGDAGRSNVGRASNALDSVLPPSPAAMRSAFEEPSLQCRELVVGQEALLLQFHEPLEFSLLVGA